MPKLLSALLFMALALPAAAVPAEHAANMAESRKIFSSQVRSLLKEHCLRCHGGEKTKSGFDLVTREGLLRGGDEGLAVVPGDLDQSLLYQAVAHLDKDLAMPPKKPKLPADAIAAIKKWIELGAAYDGPLLEKSHDAKAPMQVSAQDRAYWAYAPLRQDPAPPTDDDSHREIDRFIFDKLRQEGLEPSQALGKHQLIRRAFFDLIGLPPTPGEIEKFLKDPDPQAYQNLIDDLLSRPGYGERWGRHWLDLARFAESHGFEHDYDRKFAFHYRDFVIRALNADLPYDQFVRWQIAGDEIAPDNSEAMAATGFLGAGVYPTQITSSEAERIRFDAVDDMVATMGSAMLATTIGCARCHDHKYDPIPTRDYYELLSAFTTTVRSEIELEVNKPDAAATARFEKEKKDLESEAQRYRKETVPKKLQDWLRINGEKKPAESDSPWSVLRAEPLLSKGGTKFVRQEDGSYLATGANPKFDTYTFVASAPFENVRALRIEALAHNSMKKGGPGRAGNGNFALGDVQVKAGSTALNLANPRSTFNQSATLHVTKTIDGDLKTSWAVDPQFGKNHAAVYEVSNPEAVRGTGRRLKIVLKFEGNTQHNIGRLRISVSNRPAAGLPLREGEVDPALAATAELLALHQSGASQDQMEELYLQLDEGWASLSARINTLEANRPQTKKEKVMVCSEGFKPMRHHTNSGKVPDFYKESYYLIRGDPAQKDGLAPQGFLQVLMRKDSKVERWKVVSETGARTSMKRIAVANWITDVDQGAGQLLARVIVNRMWQHHFGRGLAATPNDFGFQGSRPTHPALLDFLARDLIANGWKLKRMHKKIMLSRSYAMGSSDNANNARKDPENRFWWKRDPRRLEAEIIRDNALAVSGLLDRRMFGPGTLDQKMKRRSIYFFVKRSKLIPAMQLFDWPDSMSSQGRRAVTTTPSQALVFLNSPEVREMARNFAQSVAQSKDPIGTAVLRAHGKPPTQEERSLMTSFLNAQIESYGGNKEPALVDFCHALLASNEMIYIQ
jgi:cytochrome c553